MPDATITLIRKLLWRLGEMNADEPITVRDLYHMLTAIEQEIRSDDHSRRV